jgi:hypothetical protein
VRGQPAPPLLVAAPKPGHDQRFLGRELLVEALEGSAGRGAQLVHPDGLHAAGVEQRVGCIEDLVVAQGIAARTHVL